MIQHFKILKEKVLQKNKKFINIEILKNKSFIKLSANNKQFEKWIDLLTKNQSKNKL
jgi:predicted acetyltransferase